MQRNEQVFVAHGFQTVEGIFNTQLGHYVQGFVHLIGAGHSVHYGVYHATVVIRQHIEGAGMTQSGAKGYTLFNAGFVKRLAAGQPLF